mmetsp:Transcript_86725/g.250285  ORF Transcript_86725/g.250285 Transcript_86725/m.250285 type:complete len:282 (-) Transcript_86725:272-1117(-)
MVSDASGKSSFRRTCSAAKGCAVGCTGSAAGSAGCGGAGEAACSSSGSPRLAFTRNNTSATTWLAMVPRMRVSSAFTAATACCTGSKAAKRAALWACAETAGNFFPATSRDITTLARSSTSVTSDCSDNLCMAASNCLAACCSDSMMARRMQSPAISWTCAGMARTFFRMSSFEEVAPSCMTPSMVPLIVFFATSTLVSTESRMIPGMTCKSPMALSTPTSCVSLFRMISATIATLSCTSVTNVDADAVKVSSTWCTMSPIDDMACCRWCKCMLSVISFKL